MGKCQCMFIWGQKLSLPIRGMKLVQRQTKINQCAHTHTHTHTGPVHVTGRREQNKCVYQPPQHHNEVCYFHRQHHPGLVGRLNIKEMTRDWACVFIWEKQNKCECAMSVFVDGCVLCVYVPGGFLCVCVCLRVCLFSVCVIMAQRNDIPAGLYYNNNNKQCKKW